MTKLALLAAGVTAGAVLAIAPEAGAATVVNCQTLVNHTSGNTYQVAERNWSQGGILYHVIKAGTEYCSAIFSDHTTYDVGVNYGTKVVIELSGNGRCLPRNVLFTGNNSLGLVGTTTTYTA